MIPRVTQDGPNIVERFWCSVCDRALVPHGRDTDSPGYSYCPGCGQHVEWDKAVHKKWEPMNCDVCGKPIIYELLGKMVSGGEYVGTTTCRACMEEYCSTTNCLSCEKGTYPNCRLLWLKHRHATEGRK